MGGEKDLSASIKRAFLVEEMSRDGTGSLSPFATLPTLRCSLDLHCRHEFKMFEKK